MEPSAPLPKKKSFTEMKSLVEFQGWHISMNSSQPSSDCHFMKSKYLTPLKFDKHSELLNQIEIIPWGFSWLPSLSPSHLWQPLEGFKFWNYLLNNERSRDLNAQLSLTSFSSANLFLKQLTSSAEDKISQSCVRICKNGWKKWVHREMGIYSLTCHEAAHLTTISEL